MVAEPPLEGMHTSGMCASSSSRGDQLMGEVGGGKAWTRSSIELKERGGSSSSHEEDRLPDELKLDGLIMRGFVYEERRMNGRTLVSSWDAPPTPGPPLNERASAVLDEFMDGVEDPQRAEESVLQDNSWRRLLVSLDGALRPNPLLAWASPLEREKSELESAAAAATRGVSPSLVESGALFDALGSLQFYVDFLAADRLLSQSEGQ